MATVQQSMANVRSLLRDPKSQQPNDLSLMKRLLSKYQSLHNSLSNTGLAWSTGEFPLNVVAAREDYQVTVNNFGKALLVTSSNPATSSFVDRPIAVFNAANMNYDWDLPNNYGGWFGWDGSQANASRMAFYRQGGNNTVFVRVKPIPQMAATYTVLYGVGDWMDSASLQSELLLPEFHDLAQVRAAISLLPSSEWSDDEAVNSNRRKELSLSLKNDEAEYLANWNEYIRTVSQARMSTRYGYGGF